MSPVVLALLQLVPCPEVLKGNPQPIAGAMCRLDLEDAVCRPAARLVVDLGKGGIDLCVHGADRKTHRPRCAGRNGKQYVQQLIYRMTAPVDAPDGTTTLREVDVKHAEIGRVESLLRRRPLVRAGPDVCPYARNERRIHPRGPGRGFGSPPPPKKAPPPASAE